MNVVGVQLNSVWENKAANHDKLSAWLAANPPEIGSLVVLPEMWATGFSFDVPAITETPSLETETYLSELARHYQISLLGGVVTTGQDGRGLNQCVVYGPDGLEVARYTKIHPFSYGGESVAYGRGSEVILFDWNGFKVAPFICYDLRFPEIFRSAVQQGAELFCVIANWPQERVDHWITLLKARAIENQTFVLGVNRCGQDPNLTYSGQSVIYGPRGDLLAEGGMEESVFSANLDRLELQRYRREFPALADINAAYMAP